MHALNQRTFATTSPSTASSKVIGIIVTGEGVGFLLGSLLRSQPLEMAV